MSSLNITIQGNNLKVSEQILASNIDRHPNYDHLKTIVFGEELSKEGLIEHVDFLFRNPSARRLTKIVVCKGDAKAIFDIKPKTANSTAQFIDSILEENSRYSVHISPLVDLTILEDQLLRKNSFILPKLELQEDTIVIQGAGLFKSDKLISWLDFREVAAIKWLKNEVDRGVIEIPSTTGQNNITIQIFNNNSKVKPIFRDDKLLFDVIIELEYDIAQVSRLDYTIMNREEIGNIEQSIAKEIKEICKESFNNMKNEYGVDPFDFNKKVSNYYPLFWAENMDNWDNCFKQSHINIEVNAKLRRVGLIK